MSEIRDLQLTHAGDFREAAASEVKAVGHDLAALAELPDVLYEMAPAKAFERAAQHLANARARLEWTERLLIDEATLRSEVAVSSLATPLNRGRATVMRWSKEPLRVDEEGGFGPDLPHPTVRPNR